jgi:hypothetical protein
MVNADQVLSAIANLTFCAECHRDLDPEIDLCSQCPTCGEWYCIKCSRCACDRVNDAALAG